LQKQKKDREAIANSQNKTHTTNTQTQTTDNAVLHIQELSSCNKRLLPLKQTQRKWQQRKWQQQRRTRGRRRGERADSRSHGMERWNRSPRPAE